GAVVDADRDYLAGGLPVAEAAGGGDRPGEAEAAKAHRGARVDSRRRQVLGRVAVAVAIEVRRPWVGGVADAGVVEVGARPGRQGPLLGRGVVPPPDLEVGAGGGVGARVVEALSGGRVHQVGAVLRPFLAGATAAPLQVHQRGPHRGSAATGAQAQAEDRDL